MKNKLSKLASATVLVITGVLGEQEACEDFWCESSENEYLEDQNGDARGIKYLG
jgi:hypothetical protein